MNRNTLQPPGSRPQPQPQLSTHQSLLQSLNQLKLPKSPSRTDPILTQFQTFLNNYKILTNSIFHQISSNNTIPNQTPEKLLNDLNQLDQYLIKLLSLHSQHDQNCKRMNTLMNQIKQIGQDQLDEKIRKIYNAEKKLNSICLDGEKEKEKFRRIESLSLKPTQILNHAKLIAPYTSAPPAPPTTNPNNATIATAGLDLQDPALRFLMPFPTEDIIRRGRMGQEMSGLDPSEIGKLGGNELGPVVGETRSAAGVRPSAVKSQAPYPTMSSRRPPPPEAEDDLFDLDLNPDL
ncbi:vitamin-D-receptor interacting mediator subunit 4-domain-containing protein [Melampsora americana]|nr:vitamin-D-receptor interacting mediator subunit 4-domain-containing protein [Melampsora americana]